MRFGNTILGVVVASSVLVGMATGQEDPTVLGALSDTPPKQLRINGKTVTVYEHARNPILSQQGRNREMTYFYAVPPTLERDEQSNAVRSYAAIGESGKEVVQLTLLPQQLDEDQLFAAVQKDVNAFARRANILPVMLHGLDAKIGNLELRTIPMENAAPFSEPLSVEWVLPGGSATQVKEALKSGARVQVGYRTLVKLSQEQSTSLKWSDVKSTKAFRDYAGPSGPQVLTAAQVVDLMSNIRSELKVFHWREAQAREGGETSQEFAKQLDKLVDRLVDRRQTKEASFEEWLDPARRMVPLAQWQQMIDETKSVAIDAKSLDDNQWCNKYRNALSTLSKRQSSGDSGMSFGLSAVIPKIKTPIGLNFGKNSSDSDYSEDSYNSEITTENCGRHIVENNFKYDWNGVKYEPKAIYVYENIATDGTISDSEEYSVYTIRQKYGRNTWSID